MSEPTYEERYCAFADILGFRNLIQGLRDGTADPKSLKRILTQIHDPVEARRDEFASSDFRALSVSDAVALSTATTPSGLGHLFFVLQELTLSLLFEGLFLRGAIVKGNLYHDSKTVFGEALVEAYRLESEVARYPRIMLVREVVKDATVMWGKDYKARLRHDDDGPAFVHVLRPVQADIAAELLRDSNVDAGESDQLNYYVQIGAKLLATLTPYGVRP